jgi:hypothetical protein
MKERKKRINQDRKRTVAERVRAYHASKVSIDHFDVSASSLTRRQKLEADPAAWLLHYLKDAYPLPFGDIHHAIIEGYKYATETGGNFACAAPRGSGKSSVFWGLSLLSLMSGRERFPAYLPWAAKDQRKGLRFWKNALCFNDKLCADYPEICLPFKQSKGQSQRCNAVTWEDGTPAGAQLKLSDGLIVLPSNLGVIGSATINGNPRGLNHATESGEVLRPGLILIDDPQDKETAKSMAQVAATIDVIDSDVAGMGGPDKSLALLMACTVLVKGDVADHYLNAADWKALRVGQIITWPTDMKLWKEWNNIRLEGESDQDGGKAARAFYKAHNERLTDGLTVSWDHRFDKSRGQPDALYGAMYDYFRMGHDAFMAERQNDPVEAGAGKREYTLTPSIIESRINDLPPATLPAWVSSTIAATDLNPSYALSTAVIGFGSDQTAAVLWYGLHPMEVAGDVPAPERARQVYAALVAHGKQLAGMPCRPETWIIDAGGTDFDTVLRFVSDCPRLCGLNAIGATGKSSKAYRPFGKNVIGQPREGCHIRSDVVNGRPRKWMAWNADYWREIAQRAWLGAVGSPGSCSLFVGSHHEFAGQIAREQYMGKADIGGQMIWNWHTQPGKHDYGDCMAMCYVGAALIGIGTGGFASVAKKYIERRKPKVQREF